MTSTSQCKSVPREIGRQLLQCFSVPVGQRNMRSLSDERPCNCLADSARGAGDQPLKSNKLAKGFSRQRKYL